MKQSFDYTGINSTEKSAEHENRFLSKIKNLKTSKNDEILQNSEKNEDKLK